MENRIKTDFNFKPTGIGSVPYTNIKDTCLNILKHLPEIPYWPQFVKLSHLENMTIQFSEGLPLLELDEKHGSLAVSSVVTREIIRHHKGHIGVFSAGTDMGTTFTVQLPAARDKAYAK